MTQLDLDQPASQSQFARILGCSQPAISKHVNKGTLPAGGTYAEWFNALYMHLQDQAAGRGSSLTDELNRARIEETQLKSASARLDYQMKIGAVIPSDWAAQNLRDWAAQANREYLAGLRDYAAEIQSAHKIEIDPELTTNHAGAVIRRIADHAGKLAAGLAGDS